MWDRLPPVSTVNVGASLPPLSHVDGATATDIFGERNGNGSLAASGSVRSDGGHPRAAEPLAARSRTGPMSLPPPPLYTAPPLRSVALAPLPATMELTRAAAGAPEGLSSRSMGAHPFPGGGGGGWVRQESVPAAAAASLAPAPPLPLPSPPSLPARPATPGGSAATASSAHLSTSPRPRAGESVGSASDIHPGRVQSGTRTRPGVARCAPEGGLLPSLAEPAGSTVERGVELSHPSRSTSTTATVTAAVTTAEGRGWVWDGSLVGPPRPQPHPFLGEGVRADPTCAGGEGGGGEDLPAPRGPAGSAGGDGLYPVAQPGAGLVRGLPGTVEGVQPHLLSSCGEPEAAALDRAPAVGPHAPPPPLAASVSSDRGLALSPVGAHAPWQGEAFAMPHPQPQPPRPSQPPLYAQSHPPLCAPACPLPYPHSPPLPPPTAQLRSSPSHPPYPASDAMSTASGLHAAPSEAVDSRSHGGTATWGSPRSAATPSLPFPPHDNRSWVSATVMSPCNTSIAGDEHRMNFYTNNASMARSFYFPEGAGAAGSHGGVYPVGQGASGEHPLPRPPSMDAMAAASWSSLRHDAQGVRRTAAVAAHSLVGTTPASELGSVSGGAAGLSCTAHPPPTASLSSPACAPPPFAERAHATSAGRTSASVSPMHAAPVAAVGVSQAIMGSGSRYRSEGAHSARGVGAAAAASGHIASAETSLSGGSFMSAGEMSAADPVPPYAYRYALQSHPPPPPSQTQPAAYPVMPQRPSPGQAASSVGSVAGRAVSPVTTPAAAAMTRPSPPDFAVLQQQFADYMQFKNQCTEAYLTRIERTVDTFLASYYNPRGGGRGERTPGGADRGSPTFMNKAGARLSSWFKQATAGISHHTRTQPTKDRGDSDRDRRVAQVSVCDVQTSPRPLPGASPRSGGALASGPLSRYSSLSSLAPGEDCTRSSGVSSRAPSLRSVQPPTLATGSRDSMEDVAGAGGDGGGARRPSLAGSPRPESVPYPMYPLRYTPDAVPEDYIDRRPSSSTLRAVIENYPILLHALKHLLPPAASSQVEPTHSPTSPLSAGAMVRGGVTASPTGSLVDVPRAEYFSPLAAPYLSGADGYTDGPRSPSPARGLPGGVGGLGMALHIIADPATRIPYDPAAHAALCEQLILPLVRTIWREYLDPLLAKLNEYMAKARAMVRPLLLDAVAGLAAPHSLGSSSGGGGVCGGGAGAGPMPSPGVDNLVTGTPQQQQQCLRVYQVLQGDAEYIATIALMDTEFVSEYEKTRQQAGGALLEGVVVSDAVDGDQRGRFVGQLRGAARGAISDYVPVYGLIMSRLHRLEMEHRTVLELWGGPDVKLSSARRGITSRKSWALMDIRPASQSAKSFTSLNQLQRLAHVAQRELQSPAAHRGANTFQADMQSSLLSRPGGRRTRTDDPQSVFHYKRKKAGMDFDAKAFRQHYNSS